MNPQQRELQSRIARFIAEMLARRHHEQPPLFRTQVAYEAANSIVSNALENGTTLEEIENNLARLEAREYQI